MLIFDIWFFVWLLIGVFASIGFAVGLSSGVCSSRRKQFIFALSRMSCLFVPSMLSTINFSSYGESGLLLALFLGLPMVIFLIFSVIFISIPRSEFD